MNPLEFVEQFWKDHFRVFRGKDNHIIENLIDDCKMFLSLLEEFHLRNQKDGILKLGDKPIDELNRLFKAIKKNTKGIPFKKVHALGRLIYVQLCLACARRELEHRNGLVIKKDYSKNATFNTHRKRLRSILRESRKKNL